MKVYTAPSFRSVSVESLARSLNRMIASWWKTINALKGKALTDYDRMECNRILKDIDHYQGLLEEPAKVNPALNIILLKLGIIKKRINGILRGAPSSIEEKIIAPPPSYPLQNKKKPPPKIRQEEKCCPIAKKGWEQFLNSFNITYRDWKTAINRMREGNPNRTTCEKILRQILAYKKVCLGFEKAGTKIPKDVLNKLAEAEKIIRDFLSILA